MLPQRPLFVLRLEQLERANQIGPRRVRLDHVIEEAARGGLVGIVEGGLVLGGLLLFEGDGVGGFVDLAAVEDLGGAGGAHDGDGG